jgi:preprotein translocase subunit SecG
MELILLLVHLIACVGIIALVLLQQGKGSDIGAAFGSGASNTVFGSPGSASFLLKLTGFAGLVFFATSIILGYGAAKIHRPQKALDSGIILPIAPDNGTPGTTTSGGANSGLGISLPQPENNGSQGK